MPNKTLVKWEEKTLSEVCTITAGQSPESQFYNTEGKGLPFYQGKKEFTNKYIGDPTVWTTKITKEAFAGDILMSVRAPVGPINYATQKCCIGRGLASIRKTEKISNDFLFYYLLSIQKEIGGHDGAVFNSISRNEIATLKIKLPPLQEQKGIVKILDEAFEDIEKAKQNALQNLNNAKELFESRLHKTFLNIDKNVNKKLSELAQIIGGGTPSKDNKSFYIGDIPWATVRDMNTDLLTETEFLINEDAVKNSSTNIIPAGNIIIATRVGLGKVCILAQDTAINQDLKGIMPVKQITSKFLFWWFKSIKNKIVETGVGATVKGVKLPFIQNLDVPFIDIKEQQKIVAQLDELQEQTKKLEQIYEQKIKDLDELKQSILQKAFHGEL